jgi:hydrogenase-4 component B
MDDQKVTYNPNKIHIFDKLALLNSAIVISSLVLLFVFVSYTQNWFGLFSLIEQSGRFSAFLYDLTHLKYAPLLVIFVPILGAGIQLFYGQAYAQKRDKIIIYMTYLTIVLIMLMYPSAKDGTLHLEIPGVLGLGLSFHVDMLGYTVLFVSAFIWFFVMVYAHEYMNKEKHGTRFFFFLAVTYASVLGTIMSGDLLTMFLFFEIMTITSYMLVIHGQKEESYKAGFNYIMMGLIGGFLILTALLLIYFYIGDLKFTSAIVRLGELGSMKYWIMGLLVFGFGIKAGMAPVHVWLPRAHPVAPTPASALLSGIMIKVGAFGILRVATSYYFPSKENVTDYLDPIWLTSEMIGAVIIWIGIITMAIGVFLALQQSNMKKMLAYHSVSQMGYIVLGIGVALYLGYRGAMGYAGALYHILNHALFKSLLFMVAGVVYHHTKENDMYKLGGLWKKLPLTTTVCLIAAMGISGIPFFNGFVSKSLLHHGIVEAYQYGHASFFYAELMFIIVSAGTACSFIKLFYYVFLRKTDQTYPTLKRDYSSLDVALVGIALLIILIGLFPHFILDHFIIPQLNLTTYDPYFINKYIVDIKFFTGSEFLMTLLVISLGFIIFFVGKKFDLFHLHLPKWLSVEYLFFLPAYMVMKNACWLMYGDQCPINHEDFAKLSNKDSNQIGFVDRFVITLNVFNRRYESSIIKSDALIYTGFITFILVYMFIVRFL